MKKASQTKLLTLSAITLTVLSVIGYFSFQLLSTRPTIAELAYGCTKDMMMCADGTRVGRSGRDCAFVCPGGATTTSTTCPTKDIKLCPDGVGIGRSGPNCEFPSCPTPGDRYQSAVHFLPSYPTISTTSPQTLELQLQFSSSNPYAVTGADIELTYDQSKLSIDNITTSPYFSTVLSAPKISNGKVNFVYGVSPDTYQMLESGKPMNADVYSESKPQTGNTGICPQMAGSCIGKDGTSCVTYTNLCGRSAVCSFPMQTCANNGGKYTPIAIATITYHSLLNPTTSPVGATIEVTPNSKVSAIGSDKSILSAVGGAYINIQADHMPGDLNGNGTVDLFDFNLLISKYGNPYTIFDFTAIIANYGNKS
jgi:hypothetical protein